MDDQRFEIRSGIEGDGGPWILDLGTLLSHEGIELQRCTGIPHTQWIKLISEDDPLALKFAFYLARKRAGEDVKYSEVEFDLRKMSAISLAEDVDDGDSDINRAMGIPDEVAAVVPTGPVTSEPDLTLS